MTAPEKMCIFLPPFFKKEGRGKMTAPEKMCIFLPPFFKREGRGGIL